MTIPANIENEVEIRPAQTGPVFYRDPTSSYLQMRYTARTRSIEWRQDSALLEAVEEIKCFLNQNNDQIIRITLQPGQGVICNNILHGRSAFSNSSSTNGQCANTERVLYRARSFNRLFSDHSSC